MTTFLSKVANAKIVQTVYLWNLSWPFEPWEQTWNVVLEVYTAGRLPQLPALDQLCFVSY